MSEHQTQDPCERFTVVGQVETIEELQNDSVVLAELGAEYQRQMVLRAVLVQKYSYIRA